MTPIIRICFRIVVVVCAVVCAVLGTRTVARAQELDTSFNPDSNGAVHVLAVQADGKILVAGQFNRLGNATRYQIARVNSDGSLDTSFDPGANNTVYAMAVQADGKILVGGDFTMLGGGSAGTTPRNYVGRLNADGSVDADFNPGANDRVRALAVQADGKILVGGLFGMLGGGGTGTGPGSMHRDHIGRLNADGSVDTSFDAGADNSAGTGIVYALAVQADGKILAGGDFKTLGGGGSGTSASFFIGRVNPDGSPDYSCSPSANDTVYALTVQADGKILVGGQFTMLGLMTGMSPRAGIGRLNSDGSLDTIFNPGSDEIGVRSFAVEADGKIVVGGTFTTLGGGAPTTRMHIGRLHADGSLDAGFNPGADSSVNALVVQPDGKILVGGYFQFLGGNHTTPRNRIGRLLSGSSGPAAPGAPRNLVGSSGGSALTLSWRAPSTGGAPTAYVIEAGSGPGLANLATVPRNNTATSFSASGVGGGVYFIRVRATNGAGSSLPSNEVMLVMGPLAPGAPSNLTASALGSNLSLTWAAPTTGGTPTAYTIEASSGSGMGSANLANFSTGNTGTAFATAGVPAGTYYVRVRATNSAGTSGPSNEVAAVVGAPGSGGAIDTSFNPGANGEVRAFAVQPDGKILVGGTFTMIGGGGTGSTARNRIARLNADGSVDLSFNPGTNVYAVNALVVQASGQILVGGDFTTIGGGGTGITPRNGIARLNADGSVDMSFNPGKAGYVNTLAVQADRKIVAGGVVSWGLYIGSVWIPVSFVGRLNADGSVDPSISPGANDVVYGVAVQADGRILVVGRFVWLGATARSKIGRLNADGSLDTSFNPGANSDVATVAVQADRKILVGGGFYMLGGGGSGTTRRNFLGRLNADGTLDAGFDPGANTSVYSIVVQGDGKILVGGGFTMLGGGGTGTTARYRIGRLNADGSLDTGFNPGADGNVNAMAVQADGKILVGGGFSKLGGGTATTLRNRIGRVLSESPSLAAPGAPNGLAGSTSGSALNLSWTAPATGGLPTAYIIEAGSGPGLANLASFSTGSTATSFAAAGVSNGLYYIRVRATNSAGTSWPSNDTIVTVGCIAAPNVPTWLGITQNSGGRVAFRWNAATGAPTTYVLEAGSASGLADLANVDLGGPGTTFATSGVGVGTYYVRVRAANTCGRGGASNQVTLVVQ